ncbi:type II toxin-antitoxin system VapC family toxin [Sphingomonas bacterium]|uniref:type II toxin-antitoxin system VapC family toxin n=1 Tax=Sphingomonas bacterium TaxID=1895847 RepID=UPI001576AB15|nr:type II toxin-antitoxin system VapC family toxin [Sphingomonas bacterium]
MIVIDTHALVWMVEGGPDLGSRAQSLIVAELEDDGVLIAPISFWELAMLVDKGRLTLGRPVVAWWNRVLLEPGFVVADLTAEIGADAGMLPGNIHGDPADRLIIATARSINCPVLTADGKILDYAAAGHVQVIDARH